MQPRALFQKSRLWARLPKMQKSKTRFQQSVDVRLGRSVILRDAVDKPRGASRALVLVMVQGPMKEIAFSVENPAFGISCADWMFNRENKAATGFQSFKDSPRNSFEIIHVVKRQG